MDIEDALRAELQQLRSTRADFIIYLVASIDTLHARASRDTQTRRPTFERWLRVFEPLAVRWFGQDPRTTFLDTDCLTQADVLAWTESFLTRVCNTMGRTI